MRSDNEYPRTHQRRGCIFIYITALARIFGLITVASLGFVTYVEWSVIDSLIFPIYVTIATIIVAYLELLWIFDKCIPCCICCFRSETCLYWMCCLPIDNWIKAIIYIGLSIPFLVPTLILLVIQRTAQGVGILLFITGLLYFIKTFKYKRIDVDYIQEDDNLFDRSNTLTQPSISTQTTSIGINNDSLSSEFK